LKESILKGCLTILFHILLIILAICWHVSVEEKISTHESIARMPVIEESFIKNPKEGQLINTKEGVKYYSGDKWHLLKEKR